MIEYYLINKQDYFAAGYTISRGQAYVDTTGGLKTAASVKAATAAAAKASLYAQVLATPAAQSERTTLTAVDEARLTAKLDADFEVIGTADLASC
ncbi:hypothetical protein [Lacticaseibacillus daqingensis]|uniref:hypothetical protein n=1 Tax=Lacticaseibacillus daqingensis TaxID=2486014 RepID=UPI000F792DE3|nr:hypothetical protein [Lacticaseibacillus daqingensis]